MGPDSLDKPAQRNSESVPNVDGKIPRGELKRRASAGIFIVGTRGLAIVVVGFLGNVVVARLLTPHDFGVVAIGMSLVVFTGLLSDGGIGSGLIRRAQPPDAEELQSLTAFQLTITTIMALAILAVGIPFGQTGRVTALMVCSMPLVALQFPGKIMLERALSYRPLAIVEVSQVLTYYAWAIGTVVAGFGVWGLASATVARAVAGALLMAVVSPVGLVRPRFSWQRIRPLVGFGIRVQATTATWLVRDPGLNALIAAIANVTTLGLWSLARRLLEVPLLLFDSLWRISYPAMSQLAPGREEAAPLIERAVGIAAVGSGLILTGLAGSAPGLIPGVFGEQWRGASAAIPWACLGLGIAGPVSVCTQGYLYYVGDASAPLRASLFQTITLFAVTIPLIPRLGVSAPGLGLLISSLVEAIMLGRATRKWTPANLVRVMLAPVGIGIGSAGIGWLLADLGGADLLSGIAGGLCSVFLFLAGLFLLRKKLLFGTFRFIAGSMRASASGRFDTAVTQP